MDLNCELCANKKECFDNHWCVTMDRGRKINNEYICDNFELSGRKYEELKEKNKKLEKDNYELARRLYELEEYAMEEIKKLRCIHLADKRDNEKLCNAIEEVKFLNAVIDMMAEEILKITKANDISNYLKQFSNYDIDFVKQYYFKKARGESE